MSSWFMLVGREVVPAEEADAVMQPLSERRVGLYQADDVAVSTIFLALDHGFPDAPQLFETLVFGGPFDGHGDRYATLDEAERGHAEWVARVQAPPFFWLGVAAEAAP